MQQKTICAVGCFWDILKMKDTGNPGNKDPMHRIMQTGQKMLGMAPPPAVLLGQLRKKKRKSQGR
jgi:hypothetical protein